MVAEEVGEVVEVVVEEVGEEGTEIRELQCPQGHNNSVMTQRCWRTLSGHLSYK